MDLSRLLRRLVALGLTAFVLAGCLAKPGTIGIGGMPLPTAAVVASLNEVAPLLVPPTPPVTPRFTATLPAPTEAPQPTDTPTPTPTPLPTDIPTATPVPTPDPARMINGIPFEAFAVIPPEAADHVRQIAAAGRALGRDPRHFSKLGDSAVLVDSNLTRFDNGPVTLGPYAFLQPGVDYYAGSWARYGAGARVGLAAVGVFDPMWANPAYCTAGEHMLACEIRLNNPGVLLIRLGTNDGNAELYERYMRQIVEYTLDAGVIPVLGTKADRFEGDDSINQATRRLAAEYRVPLWDFDLLAETLPNRGLSEDWAHLTMLFGDDFSDPTTFSYGYPVSDLSALVILDAIRQLTE